jgi:hypothetical protein
MEVLMLALVMSVSVFATEWNPTWTELRAENGWALSYTDEQSIGKISVYKKTIDKYPCFQGRASTTQPVSTMMGVASDIEGARQWSSAGITKAKTLGGNQQYLDYYQYLDIPILSDRHWFLRGYFEKDGAETRFRWERLDQGKPYSAQYKTLKAQSPDAVEPPINIGAWVFIEKDSSTEVRYYICTHPGGSVPASLQSIGTEKTLPNNVYDLIVESEKRNK